MQIKCLTGLVESKVMNATASGKPKNFDEWILRVMGPGIADIFMRPYNFKVSTELTCKFDQHEGIYLQQAHFRIFYITYLLLFHI